MAFLFGVFPLESPVTCYFQDFEEKTTTHHGLPCELLSLQGNTPRFWVHREEEAGVTLI